MSNLYCVSIRNWNTDEEYAKSFFSREDSASAWLFDVLKNDLYFLRHKPIYVAVVEHNLNPETGEYLYADSYCWE